MPSITINFMNADLTSTNCAIRLTGAAYALSTNESLSIRGNVAFNSLDLTTSAIDFNVTPGTIWNATVEAIVVSDAAGTSPEIEVTNFTGMVTVVWPTARGPETQTLESGNSMTLSGYVG